MAALMGRVRSALSPILKPPLRRVRYRLADLADRRGGETVMGVPLPPPSLRRLNGPDDFVATGEKIAAGIASHTGLGEGDDVLDAGCGVGRVALAMIDRLGPTGSYEGFDIVPEAIAWCQRRITPEHPNFRFQLADVHNHHYHRGGRQRAEEYRFPYDDASFDIVFLTSIFTHLGAAPTSRYLHESFRVLRPGGRLFASFFLIDDEARQALADGRADMQFVPMADGAFTTNLRDPDAAVAHDESTIREVLASCGFVNVRETLRGNWSGRATSRRQDVLVAERPPS